MKQKLRVFLTLLLCAVASVGWGQTTYKLQQVTSVEAGGLYVFEQGGYVMNNTVSSKALQTTNTYNNTGLSGTESYIWKLETSGSGFNMRNASLGTSYNYLYNSGSATDVSLSNSKTTWVFNFQDDGTVVIQQGNTDGRFLGYTSSTGHAYKAYAASNLSSGNYPHAIKVYQLVEESGETPTLEDNDLSLSPTSLEFNLYDGASAKIISYTTSSTGAVTVSACEYVTTEVNETAKTITVTPVAKTSEAQTITVNQAADDNYKTGTATFTVSITDSTPFEGGDVTFDATKDKGNTTAGEGSIEKNGITFSCDNGILGNGSEYRLYKNSVTTFSVTQGAITQIAFTCKSGNPASGFSEQTGWTTEGNNGTWTGNAQSVTFTASEKQVQATKIVVTVDLSATPDPTFTILNNEEIAYNATSGSFDFTVNNPVNDGVTTVSENVDWISNAAISGNNVSFTTTVNNAAASRSGVITLTYTYGTNNETVTKEVTVTQAGNPNITNIPDLFAAANSTAATVSVTFNDWVVSGVSTNGKNVFVTDNNGNGFVIFNSDGGLGDTYAVGSILSGTVSCSLKKNYGYAQLTGVSGLTITTGGSVTEASIEMANLAGVNTGALVSYDNLTCQVSTSGNYTNYDLTDGTTTIRVYNSLFAFGALEAGKTYNITGIYQQYNNTKEILPRNADDIVVVEEASITVNPNPVEVAAAGGEGTIDVTYNYITDVNAEVQFFAADGTTSESYDWIEAELDDNNNIYYVVSENTSSEARTAYLKVYALDDNAKNIYSELITITQAAAATPGTGDSYELFSGELVEGDYIIYYEGKAMNTTITNNRLQYAEVTPANNVISTDNTAIVWHIAKSGDYWTIYNADANAYAAATSSNNQAQMLVDGTDDKAQWTVSDEYDFTNKANSRLLRNNGTYGFACYGATTGGALSLYKKVTDTPETESVTVGSAGYTTYVTKKNVAIPEVVEVYIVTDINESSIHMDRVTGAIPANTPIVVKASANNTYELAITENEAADVSRNLLRASNGTVTGDGSIYALGVGKTGDAEGKVGFYRVKSGAKVPAGKAYLNTSVVAKDFLNFDFGETDGIGQIEIGQTSNAEIYNLSGQRVNKAQKGIYIVNGKKVVIK